jgi:hypothetical protein
MIVPKISFDNCRLTDLTSMLAAQHNFAQGWQGEAVTLPYTLRVP